MADIALIKNVGAVVNLTTSVVPQSASAGTINGTGIDRQKHGNALSVALHAVTGAVSGAPTTTSVIAKLQDSADGTTFADYKPDGVNVAQFSGSGITAGSADASLSVDLTAARRYIRVVLTTAFTGGTTPSVMVASDLVFGGERVLPAV